MEQSFRLQASKRLVTKELKHLVLLGSLKMTEISEASKIMGSQQSSEHTRNALHKGHSGLPGLWWIKWWISQWQMFAIDIVTEWKGTYTELWIQFQDLNLKFGYFFTVSKFKGRLCPSGASALRNRQYFRWCIYPQLVSTLHKWNGLLRRC